MNVKNIKQFDAYAYFESRLPHGLFTALKLLCWIEMRHVGVLNEQTVVIVTGGYTAVYEMQL